MQVGGGTELEVGPISAHSGDKSNLSLSQKKKERNLQSNRK